jgi:hypothetical protein
MRLYRILQGLGAASASAHKPIGLARFRYLRYLRGHRAGWNACGCSKELLILGVTIIPPSDLRPQNRRRSKRVLLRVPVIVRLRDAGKQSLAENTEAIIVNDHGALILLAATVKVNQIIRIENPNVREELLCRVTSVGPTFMGKTQVGIEFIVPTPGFWKVPAKPKDSKDSEPARNGKKEPVGAVKAEAGAAKK